MMVRIASIKRLCLWSLALTILLIVPPVSACEFKIANFSFIGGSTIAYDVFASLPHDKITAIDIERIDKVLAVPDSDLAADIVAPTQLSPSIACNARIRIAPSGVAAVTRAGSRLNYNLISNEPSVPSIEPRNLESVIRNMLPGEVRRFEFSVQIVAGQLVTAGSYSGSVLVSVGPESMGSTALAESNDEELLRLQAMVAASARMSFAGVQGRNRMVDFGAIKSGSKPIFQPAILVQSTAGYRLRFRSDNHGQLVRDGRGPKSALPYDLNVAGEAIDLGSINTEVLFSTAIDLSNNKVPLEFHIPDARLKRAGVYRDRVVVEIVPIVR